MWTSERNRRLPLREAEAELGVVTLGGDPAGVVLGGERRQLPVYSPGGYRWIPREGDRVLVLKAGGEGEVPCVIGTVQPLESLQPGEVYLTGGESSIRLGRRQLELTGTILVNGMDLESYIKSVAGPSLGTGTGGEDGT